MVLAACLSLGCGGKSDLTEAGGEGGSGGGGGGPGCPDSGPCVTTDCGSTGCTWDCELPTLCPEVEFTGQGFAGSGDVTGVSSVDDAQCLLAALRDGTEGTLGWQTRISGTDGNYVRGRLVHLRPNRLALVRASAGNPGEGTGSQSLWGPTSLEPASTYDACVTLTEPAALHDCLVVAACE